MSASNFLGNVFPVSFTDNGECTICYEKKDKESDKCKENISQKGGQVELQTRFLSRLCK